MTIIDVSSRRTGRGRPLSPAPRAGRRRPSDATLLLAGCFTVYSVAGAILVFGYHSELDDVISRVSNASAVLDSRQPGQAAIGLLWTPLSSLLLLPFLPVKALWPDLVARGYLANLESAAAMALTARALLGVLTDLRLPRRLRLAISILFALQPIILWYGSNGTRQALLLLFAMVVTRRLVRWMSSGSRRELIVAGLTLAVGYTAGYEILAAALGAILLVGATTAVRTPGTGAERTHAAVTDALLIGFPVLATSVVLATVSGLIVGHPFQPADSRYGNPPLTQGLAGPGQLGPTAASHLLHQLFVLSPLAASVAAVAAVVAARRRDGRFGVPVVLFGPMLVFDSFQYLHGSLPGLLRYQIGVLPLTLVLVGLILAPAAPSAPPEAVVVSGRALPWALGVSVIVVSSVVCSAAVFTEPTYASQEYAYLRPAVLSLLGDRLTNDGGNGDLDQDMAVAHFIDGLHLPAGAVLLDSGSGFAVLAATQRPRMFVIPPDTDFQAAVTDPAARHILYLLVEENPAFPDIIRQTWPDLGERSGPAWARLSRSFASASPLDHDWRLWRVEG
jgi:hypothetical protein